MRSILERLAPATVERSGVLAAGSLGAGALGVIAFAAANEVAPGGGLDLQGIALIITAITGLIATVGGLVIGFRRKPIDPMQAALAQAFLDQAARLKHDEETSE